MQFQSFLEDPQYKDQHELQATMIRTFGKVAPHAEPHFRDEGSVEAKLECCCLIVFLSIYTRPETNLSNLKQSQGKWHRTNTRLRNRSVGT